jgi:hypothetical protein
MRDVFEMEVRAAENCRKVLGHVRVPMPPAQMPPYFTFGLRTRSDEYTVRAVTLAVEKFADPSGATWHAFKVPAAQWEEIKDMVIA